MNPILRVAVAVPAVIFVAIGLAWHVAPAFVASELGMPLLDGVGRSTQIADLASFFLTSGACVLLGAFTRERLWFAPAVMMLGLAAAGRVLAWAVHGAALAWDMILVEVVVAGLLVVAATRSAPADPA